MTVRFCGRERAGVARKTDSDASRPDAGDRVTNAADLQAALSDAQPQPEQDHDDDAFAHMTSKEKRAAKRANLQRQAPKDDPKTNDSEGYEPPPAKKPKPPPFTGAYTHDLGAIFSAIHN